MPGKFYLSLQSGVVLLSQLTDKETKAQRRCVAESVTGRAWTPALVILGQGEGLWTPGAKTPGLTWAVRNLSLEEVGI